MSSTVVGVFDTYEAAERAAREVKEKGLRTDDISIVAKEDDGRGDSTDTFTMTNDNEEAAMVKKDRNDNVSDGVITGGILGGLAGLLIGAGSMFVPGLGIIAAAGPITGLLSGAVTGGIVGGLVDLGIPEKRSKEYESHVKEGRVLFTMRADDEKIGQVKTILSTNGAISVEDY